MKAITIEPKKPGTGQCENIREPDESEGSILVEAVAVGDAAATEVLKNNVLAGSVHANKRHWYKSSERLARLDRKWLNRMIRRRETTENFGRALERKPDDIKIIIRFSGIQVSNSTAEGRDNRFSFGRQSWLKQRTYGVAPLDKQLKG